MLGLGDTGLSMARWLARRGARVRVADSRAEPPHRARLAREVPAAGLECGPLQARQFEGVDLVAVSPGIDRREPVIAAAAARGVPMAGDVELFAQALPRQGRPQIVAITGTNGKSTVTQMAGDMCARAGRDTVVAGNIGLPVLDALAAIEDGRRPPEVFVLELSSFQLETTASLAPDAATVLNVTEDHLDRYRDIEDYAQAKARIFAGARVQVVNRDDARTRGMARPEGRVLSFGLDAPRGGGEWGIERSDGAEWLAGHGARIMPAAELPVVGRHNAANALAALALGHAIGLADAPMAAALREFRGLAHRVERVAEIAGVTWYDDSKGTNVGSTVAALAGMPQPVVLIAGGDGKGQDFAPLADVMRGVRALVLIGRDREQIAAAVAASGVRIERADSLEDAVRRAQGLALPGDAVLLSPACASYDMFANYLHRAETFVAAVRSLAGERG